MTPLGYFGIRADQRLEEEFAAQSKEQLVSLASQILEAITLAEFDHYEDQKIIAFDSLEAMTINERLNWLKACVNRMEEIEIS